MGTPLSVLQERKGGPAEKRNRKQMGGRDLSKPQTSLVARRLGQIRSLCAFTKEKPSEAGIRAGCVATSSTVPCGKEKATPRLDQLRPTWWRRRACWQSLPQALAPQRAALRSLQPCDCVWRRLLPSAKFRGFHRSLYLLKIKFEKVTERSVLSLHHLLS